MQVFRNNFSSTFLDPVAGSPSAHQIRIARDAAGSLDTPLAQGDYYLLTAYRVVNGREVDVEVMKATSVAVAAGAYTLTVERAQEQAGQATTAQAYGVGDFVEARFTAGAAQRMLQADDNLRTVSNTDLALNNLGAGPVGLALFKATSVADVIALLGLEGGGGTPIAPSILVQPQSTSVTQGASAVFSVTAIGQAIQYQWMRNGEDIDGATAASYTVTLAALGDSGALFSCRLQNAGGTTVTSEAQLTVTASAVAPGAVTNLQPGTPTSTTQPLTWDAPSTGTSPFTYQVAYRLGASTGAFTNFGSPVSGTSATVTGLTASTAYDYQVTPINSVGPGTAAVLNDVSTASPTATAPGAPAAPTATAGDGTVSATWAAPTSNGGSAILEYRLRWNGGAPVEMGDADLSGSMPAANGTAGTLEVSARNAIGWGDWSPASNSVTPQAAPVVSRIDVLQRFNLPNTNARRIRMSDVTARDFVIVRNLESTNIMEIGFTTVGNNDANAPSSWTAVNPGQEWYETGSTNQIFVRAQTAGAPVICELETTITL